MGTRLAAAFHRTFTPGIGVALGAVTRSRTARVLYWAIPPLVCLWLHKLGFRAWFRADDFVWLRLADTVHGFHDLLAALFDPFAQGTVRPWSERAFFMAGSAAFGLNALPYRIVIFATQLANLALVAAIGARLSGIRAAGFWAAIFWTVNSSLMEPLGWACVWNEVLCGFFLLLEFWFLLRYIETGLARHNAAQWAVFLVGFGALELNAMYPALASAYTWFCARRRFGGTLAMVPVSAAYFLLHRCLAPLASTGEYAMHFDGSMLRTLWTYWTWSLGPVRLETPLRVSNGELLAGVAVLTAALAYILVRHIKARQWAALFCLIWYFVVLAPLLPLRDHLTDYYPALPMIGLSWLGGWGFAEAWRAATRVRIAAVSLACLYGLLAIPALRADSAWNYARTIRVRNFVGGLAAAHQLHPRQTILLYGVDRELFVDAVREGAHRLIGIERVYLAPGSDRQPDLEHEDEIGEFTLSGAAAMTALQRDDLVVYDVRGPRLRNITAAFARMPVEPSLPATVNVADPFAAGLLGPEWYPTDGNHRWMPKRATLRMAGPWHASQRLYLRGNCSPDELRSGPLTVVVAVSGAALPPVSISSPGFDLSLALPVPNQPEMVVAIEVSRTFRAPGDPRELGLAFGEIAVR